MDGGEAGEGEGGYSAEQILRTYKEQNAIEKNFSFLKDDQIVNALFLKRPERIEALGQPLATPRDLRLEVHTGRVVRGRVTGRRNLRWVARGDLDRVPVSGATRKVLRALAPSG